MKKGDERKESILKAARDLFYERGYEKTSIQDILDETGLSKGGFYHHFESKLSLLEEICREELQNNALAMTREVERLQGDAVAQMNALMTYMAPWQPGQEAFYRLLLHVAYRGGSAQLRGTVRETLIEGARPLMREIVHAGIENKQFFTRFPDDIGELLLLLFANLCDEIFMRIARDGAKDTVLSAVMGLLDAYRGSMEMLLGAPYGSMVLCELSHIADLI